MTETTEQRPVFVYGTLRPGQGLHSVVRGSVSHIERATLAGVTMRGGQGFPYLIRDEASEVPAVGDLLYLKPGCYEAVLANLDRIEGYHGPRSGNHYDRELVEVRTSAGHVRAWVYVASQRTASRIGHLPVIISGDWLAKRYETGAGWGMADRVPSW